MKMLLRKSSATRFCRIALFDTLCRRCCPDIARPERPTRVDAEEDDAEEGGLEVEDEAEEDRGAVAVSGML